MKYVVDTWAWIEYLISGQAGDKVKEIVESDDSDIYVNSVILAEAVSYAARERKDINVVLNAITALSKIVDINDPHFSKEAGLLHAEMRKKVKDFGLADAFTVVTARKVGAKILTGDPHFKNIKGSVMI